MSDIKEFHMMYQQKDNLDSDISFLITTVQDDNHYLSQSFNI